MRTGYGECIDSFFAFGMVALARDTEFLPHALLDVLEPIVQEEVRHILFLVNWVAYKRQQQPALLRPLLPLALPRLVRGRRLRPRPLRRQRRGQRRQRRLQGRLHRERRLARSTGDFSVRGFVARCLDENTRRFAPLRAGAPAAAVRAGDGARVRRGVVAAAGGGAVRSGRRHRRPAAGHRSVIGSARAPFPRPRGPRRVLSHPSMMISDM